MTAKKPLFSREEKFLLLSLSFLQFSHIVDFMIIMPLGQQLMRVFNISPHEFGLLVSTYTFAAGFSGFLSAFIVDRLDRKKVLLFFYVGFVAGTLACAMAEGYQGLLIARTLTGAFGGVLSSLTLSIVGDAIGPERRATAMGTIMASFSVASIFGVPFSLYLATAWDWHAPFTFLGILGILLTGLIVRSIPPMTSHLVAKENRRPAFEPFLNIFKHPNQMIALAFMVLLVFGQFTVIPFISVSMVANAGLTEAQLPLIYLVGGICSIIAGPLIGRWADLFGKKRVFLISAVLSLAPIWMLTNMGTTPVPLVLAVIAFFFLCMSGRMVPATALVTSTVRPQNRGSFMSIVSSVQQFSLAGASYLAGLIVTRSVDGRLENYPVVGAIAITASILAIIANRLIVPIEGDSR